MFPEFNYYKPSTINEAFELMATLSDARFIAGGTDLLLKLRKQQVLVKNILSLKDISELREISESDQGLSIGAMATLADLEFHPSVRANYAVLHDGIVNLGSMQIRNMATIGGNLCSGLPSADTAAPLLSLDAKLEITGPEEDYSLPLSDFFVKPGKNVLKRNEILKRIIIPAQSACSTGAYVKLGRRKAMEIAIVGAAVSFVTDGLTDHCVQARVALTSSAPVPMRCPEAERYLIERRLTEEAILEAGKIAAVEAQPRTSFRTSSEYRKNIIPVVVKRAGLMALERLKLCKSQAVRGWNR